MKLKSLKLVNYRNCENVELSFCDFKNLIIGKNAQGKTNILEGIYFYSGFMFLYYRYFRIYIW